jgi:hypothetical protein
LIAQISRGAGGRERLSGGGIRPTIGWASALVWWIIFMAAGASSVRTVEVRGRVVDESGGPLGGVTVLAVDWGTGAISARVSSDQRGGFSVVVPARRRQQLEADGPGWFLLRREARGPGEVQLVMRRQPPIAGTDDIEVTPTGRPIAEHVTGSVRDETGATLRGVRLSVVDDHARTIAVVDSDHDGRFTAVVPPGHYSLLVFAPGLTLSGMATIGPNQWAITLRVVAGLETIRIEQAPMDPDNPDARERARHAFAGHPVSNLPRVTPAVAELQASRAGQIVVGGHPVARQSLGAYCLTSGQCRQEPGPAVCCAGGELTDEYLWAGGRAGACTPAKECPGAAKYAR